LLNDFHCADHLLAMPKWGKWVEEANREPTLVLATALAAMEVEKLKSMDWH
jgi:hypothetical protein